MPKNLEDRPTLLQFEKEVWQAFDRLSRKRTYNGFGGVSSIPYSEIISFVDDIIEIDDLEERQLFIELIDFLDDEFRKDIMEKQEQERKKSEQQTKKPRKRSSSN